MGEIRILDQFVTTEKDPQTILSKLQRQFLNYERIVKVSTSINTATSITYSGKQHGPDDIAVTIQRAIYDRHKFTYAPMYQQFLR